MQNPKLIGKRGHSICRGCGAKPLIEILDLGLQPLPAEYGNTAEDILDVFPLNLKICQSCGLGQLGEYVLPERIFHQNYPYISSASKSWVEHASTYAKKMYEELSLDNSTLVIELASNDGYLLSEFKKLNVPVLGVEPASNVAEIAESFGIPTIVKFFGANEAESILKKYGHPRLIVANNVFAHIPDLRDFTKGISILSDENTVTTIENPTFIKLLENSLFDTIYHEHYSYHTAHSVKNVANQFNLNLVHIEQLQTHGGSNRYWISRKNNIDISVTNTLRDETDGGLFNESKWNTFAEKSNHSITELREWLIERHNAGDRVVGYGAAHKGNTFLNSVGSEAKIIRYVVDSSKEKQGKYLPGSQVPVLPPDELISCNPTDVLILPWNIADELSMIVKKLTPNARVWVAHPSMREI